MRRYIYQFNLAHLFPCYPARPCASTRPQEPAAVAGGDGWCFPNGRRGRCYEQKRGRRPGERRLWWGEISSSSGESEAGGSIHSSGQSRSERVFIALGAIRGVKESLSGMAFYRRSRSSITLWRQLSGGRGECWGRSGRDWRSCQDARLMSSRARAPVATPSRQSSLCRPAARHDPPELGNHSQRHSSMNEPQSCLPYPPVVPLSFPNACFPHFCFPSA